MEDDDVDESTIQTSYDLHDGYVTSRNAAKKQFFAGAELEIEDIETFDNMLLMDHGICIEEDGSLRGMAREFLLPPSSKTQLKELFEVTHAHIRTGPLAFSQRTSVHIHVNCIWSTPEQVRNTVLLYAIFEPLAFCFVGQERKNNIHCVPLTYTTLPASYRRGLLYMADIWSKYTALNLLPLKELGTIEFRHLYGTNNIGVFSAWLDFIETLWVAGHSITHFDKKYLTDLEFLSSVHQKLMTPNFYKFCRERPSFVLEDNLIDAKLTFI
jgi:hypothetical protein